MYAFHRFARTDELQLHTVLVGPGVERLADELRTVIYLNQVGASSSLPQLLKYTCHSDTCQREVDFDVRALAIPRVDDGQHSNAPAIHKCVRNEVHRPAFVRDIGRRHNHTQMARTLLSPFHAKRQAFLPV